MLLFYCKQQNPSVLVSLVARRWRRKQPYKQFEGTIGTPIINPITQWIIEMRMYARPTRVRTYFFSDQSHERIEASSKLLKRVPSRTTHRPDSTLDRSLYVSSTSSSPFDNLICVLHCLLLFSWLLPTLMPSPHLLMLDVLSLLFRAL